MQLWQVNVKMNGKNKDYSLSIQTCVSSKAYGAYPTIRKSAFTLPGGANAGAGEVSGVRCFQQLPAKAASSRATAKPGLNAKRGTECRAMRDGARDALAGSAASMSLVKSSNPCLSALEIGGVLLRTLLQLSLVHL